MIRTRSAVLAVAAALVVAVAVAVAGCGGGGGGKSEKQKIEATLRDYFTAFADGDGERACSHLANDTKERLVRISKAGDCPATLEQAAEQPKIKPFLSELRDAKVGTIEVDGDTALAKVTAIGQSEAVPLRKEGDAWKLTGAAGASGG